MTFNILNCLEDELRNAAPLSDEPKADGWAIRSVKLIYSHKRVLDHIPFESVSFLAKRLAQKSDDSETIILGSPLYVAKED
jgi:hypothetical protein